MDNNENTENLDSMKPSRPQKVARAIPTKLEPEVTPPEVSENRYARKPRIGSAPKLGAPVNRVDTVGLGKLRVTTATGLQTQNTNKNGESK